MTRDYGSCLTPSLSPRHEVSGNGDTRTKARWMGFILSSHLFAVAVGVIPGACTRLAAWGCDDVMICRSPPRKDTSTPCPISLIQTIIPGTYRGCYLDQLASFCAGAPNEADQGGVTSEVLRSQQSSDLYVLQSVQIRIPRTQLDTLWKLSSD